MKTQVLFLVFVAILITVFIRLNPPHRSTTSEYDIYQYVKDCKTELGIQRDLPVVSCLDGKKIPIYVDNQEINSHNWSTLSQGKHCDNPHWLGGDIGCWTYSHLQVIPLDNDNVMVVNCRQKGSQDNKTWYRDTQSNLGKDQNQRKQAFLQAKTAAGKQRLYYLYNTFNDLGIIFRNTRTGKACYLTQYGEQFTGFIPPLDKPLPAKSDYLKNYNPEHARPPEGFPEELWYRDANQAFRSPQQTAQAGCINCHNAHGFKYSPYINSSHGLPSIYTMKDLPMLLVGKPFINHFRKEGFLQLDTTPVNGEKQVCTRCHKITTAGTCGYLFEFATGHPNMKLHKWLTTNKKENWMPPVDMGVQSIYKHKKKMSCCCKNPNAKGCLTRQFGPTEVDLAEGFLEGRGWVKSEGPGNCDNSYNLLFPLGEGRDGGIK